MNYDHLRFTLRALLLDWVGKTEQAREAYEAAFRADPGDVQAARSIAWNHARKERWSAAVEWFRKALDVEPDHADTWFNLGYVLEHHGDLTAALEAQNRAVAINARHDRAWYGAGMIHARLGDHKAAAAALQVAADLQPMNGAAWYALGMAYYRDHQPDAVERTIRHLASHEPQTARRLVIDAVRPDLAHLVDAR